MAPTTKNLEDSLLAQNPRRAIQKQLPHQSTHTEVFLPSQNPSLPSSQASHWSQRPHRSHRSHCSCSQALFHSPSPSTKPHPPSALTLSRPRLITLPHSSTQTNPVSTLPPAASQETRACLHERCLGGYLKVIDSLAHTDAQAVARRIHPDTITNNMIRATLDL